MQPLLHPSSKNDPAVSNDAMGTTSCVCQCCVIACHTPSLPEGDNATNWLPMKNKYSTRTCKLKVPVRNYFNKYNHYKDVQQHTNIGPCTIRFGNIPQPDLTSEWNRNHFWSFTGAAIIHFGVNSDSFDAGINMGGSENELPATRVL